MKRRAGSGTSGRPAPSSQSGRDRLGSGRDEPRAPGALSDRSAALVGLALLAAALLLAAVVRLRLAGVPLQRDEGEYAYAGQLILKGIPPYRLAYNMKFPGTYYAYALLMRLCGETARGIHLGLLGVNAATVLLVFAIGRRLFGWLAAGAAAVAFAYLSLDRWVQGPFAHATHFVLLPALAGLYLLIRPPGPRRALRVFASGVLLGAAVLAKQHAFPFVLAGAAIVGWGESGAARRSPRRVTRELGLLAAGALLPFAAICALFAGQGVLSSFWHWTFEYARAYVSERPLSMFLPKLAEGLGTVTHAALPLWLIGGAGLAALLAGPWGRPAKIFVAALLVASFLGLCPGLYFREHYFVLLLPAVALLVGVAFESARGLLERRLPALVARGLVALAFLGAMLLVLVPESGFLFRMSPRELSRSYYGANPFIEAVEVAKYIRQRTTDADRIAVLGSEPEIYFYARRRSATGYVYVYPLMEPQRFAASMQEEMIRQIEAAHPRYVVFVQVPTSWSVRPGSLTRIVDWGDRYLGRCYEPVGVADIVAADSTRYAWDGQVAGYTPRSLNAVFVFERRSDAPCSAEP